mmetsp:Transcript_12070/g.44798  ORF Transcript_12070/g.44798 Transcript_12070/m.44798 type:complete len:226 (-) Transcript_12070:2401-3078(-)
MHAVRRRVLEQVDEAGEKIAPGHAVGGVVLEPLDAVYGLPKQGQIHVRDSATAQVVLVARIVGVANKQLSENGHGMLPHVRLRRVQRDHAHDFIDHKLGEPVVRHLRGDFARATGDDAVIGAGQAARPHRGFIRERQARHDGPHPAGRDRHAARVDLRAVDHDEVIVHAQVLQEDNPQLEVLHAMVLLEHAEVGAERSPSLFRMDEGHELSEEVRHRGVQGLPLP